MKMGEFARKNSWFLFGLAILFFVVLQNLFPEGYIIAGEDTAQFINLKENFVRMFYDWSGRASLFFGIFYLLDELGVSDSVQLSWYLGLFIFGAYLSFYTFVRLAFKNTSDFIAFLTSLFYALNLYTLTYFSYSWGYSHHEFLYVFIPLLAGLFLKFVKTEKNIFGAYFVLALFFASSGFGNPAFALSLSIFLFLLLIGSFVFNYAELSKYLIFKILVVVAFSLLVNSYWIFPTIIQARQGVASLAAGGNILDPDWWIQKTSNPVLNTLRLLQYDAFRFFPHNFPYGAISWSKEFFLALTFIPVFLLVFSLGQKKQENEKKLYRIFFFLLVCFVALTARVRFPFEKINNFIFHLPGFITMRGYEKLAIFTPFIIAVLLLIFLLNSQGKKYYKISVFLFCLILVTPLPFYFGKLEQNMSSWFYRGKKDYREAKFSHLVKIPKEYYGIQPLMNAGGDFKILSLPFSAGHSIGWADYPKWKMTGSDPMEHIYKNRLLNGSSLYFNQWLFAKDFNELDHNPEWLIKLSGMTGVKYLIYHKDTDEIFLEQSEEKISYLERKNIIVPLQKNDYFDLYEIRSDYIFPYLSWQKENAFLERNPESAEESFEKSKKEILPVEYEKINTKKLAIKIKESIPRGFLVLNEFNMDNNWRAVYQKDGKKEKLEHLDDVGYANKWKIEKKLNGGEITIEYLPAKYLWIGIVVSAASLIAVLGYIIFEKFRYAKRND